MRWSCNLAVTTTTQATTPTATAVSAIAFSADHCVVLRVSFIAETKKMSSFDFHYSPSMVIVGIIKTANGVQQGTPREGIAKFITRLLG